MEIKNPKNLKAIVVEVNYNEVLKKLTNIELLINENCRTLNSEMNELKFLTFVEVSLSFLLLVIVIIK